MRYTDNCSNLCVISYGEEEVTRLQKTSNDEDEKNMQDSFCSSLFFNCSFFLLWIEESWGRFLTSVQKLFKVHQKLEQKILRLRSNFDSNWTNFGLH